MEIIFTMDCPENDFRYDNALLMIFTPEIYGKWFYNENFLQLILL